MTGLLKRLSLISLLAFTVGTLAACDNTVRGIGQDVNETTDAVEDEAHAE